jgi:hypothetical protein
MFWRLSRVSLVEFYLKFCSLHIRTFCTITKEKATFVCDFFPTSLDLNVGISGGRTMSRQYSTSLRVF